MKSTWKHAASISVLTAGATAVDAIQDYAQYVNPFIGTEGPIPGTSYIAGNVFPGVTLPFGAVKVGIDTNLSVLLLTHRYLEPS